MLTEVIESNTVMSVGVELKSNLKRDVDIYLDVVELSASGKLFRHNPLLSYNSCVKTADGDFNGTSSLKQTFISGSNAGDKVYFDIEIFDDDTVEGDESFIVVLHGTDLLVKHNTSVVRIIDNDSKEYPFSNIIKYCISYFAAACMDFSQSVYEVLESSSFVEICADLQGSLEDYLTAYLFTVPGSATGKLT